MAQQVDHTKYIEIDAEIRCGRPVVKGTRITVYDVLGWLAAGMSHKEILEDFPQLKNEDIMACLNYPAKLINLLPTHRSYKIPPWVGMTKRKAIREIRSDSKN
jgi:uncharacterized protein (DUF433 family)